MKWTEKQLSFLKFIYRNSEYTDAEIGDIIKKRRCDITEKAIELGLLNKNEQRCSCCKKILVLDEFANDIRCTNGRRKKCRKCVKTDKENKVIESKIYSITSKIKKKQKEITSKTCSVCKTDKLIDEFHIRNASVDGYEACCKQCKLERNKKSKLKMIEERGW